jgi:hypothetical protein
MVSSSTEATFTFNFSIPGNYSLRIKVTDPSGNGRNDSLQLLVRTPRTVIAPDDDANGSETQPYLIFAIGVAVVVILIIIVYLIASRRKYDEVESEWEEEDDLDEFDDDEWDDDEEEDLVWEDDDEMEW